MPNPILILCGHEEGPYLRAKLRVHAPDMPIDVVHDQKQVAAASEQVIYNEAPYPRLIAFCTDVIVPLAVLSVFKGGTYNFHPGSPDYPGSHAASFAIYEQVESYGVTAHVMEETVDAGAIVGVEMFAVPTDCRFLDLEILAYQNLLTLFDQLAAELVATEQALPALPIQWGKTKRSRREFEQMKVVTDEMSEDEIRLRWRAFG